MPRATLGPAALLLSTAAGGNRALVASSGPISPRPSAMSVEDLGVLVDVLGAWAYATGYGPPFTCPVPLTSYSTPSRVAPCGCGRQALESLAGPRWTRQEPNPKQGSAHYLRRDLGGCSGTDGAGSADWISATAGMEGGCGCTQWQEGAQGGRGCPFSVSACASGTRLPGLKILVLAGGGVLQLPEVLLQSLGHRLHHPRRDAG